MEQLISHIKNENLKTQAWIAEVEGRWATLYSEDPQDWIDQGIHNLKDFYRNQNETFIWDGYKMIHGFRPRHINFQKMSDEDIEEMAKDLKFDLEQYSIEQDIFEKKSIQIFKERVQDTMELMNTTDKERILKILVDADGMKDDFYFYGNEWAECEWNLPVGFLKDWLNDD